jgi:hypothetical protein
MSKNYQNNLKDIIHYSNSKFETDNYDILDDDYFDDDLFEMQQRLKRDKKNNNDE